MELLTSPEAWFSLLALSAMEIVLGIDNIIFITILSGRLPKAQQPLARRLGLMFALASRLGLLFAISWVMKLTEPLFTVVIPWSGKSLILGIGGLFLLYKATHEIYENVERPSEHQAEDVAPLMADAEEKSSRRDKAKMFAGILVQITLLDIVFSLDSVITAVGMASQIPTMVAAMIIAVAVMLIFAGLIGDFVQKHASIRVLALAFLVLIGVMLMVEATGTHISKGIIYFAMAFSLGIEVLNMRMRSRRQRVLDEMKAAELKAAET
ncbi:MAG: TerC family protein [Myxococcales bacterium]|nr:TerC family protein [Myxococcales bacterium]